ncbi:acyltransferase [Roseomonas stagni]|uniref:Acyltransferase n=1 Tax=Falsiroseomonas algicola TaxID=2716930 RepID=A0A6M1LNQ2_9PROT|nr:acyltransferase [Falsiroseomonas algicola]NGM21803.1 acyltransferase [Falsiroseomonas algicola]
MIDAPKDPDGLYRSGLLGADRAGLPEPADMVDFDLSPGGIAALAARGVAVTGAAGADNWVWLPRTGTVGQVTLRLLRQASGNAILLGPRSDRCRAALTVGGHRGVVVLGGTTGTVNLKLTMNGLGNLFIQGAEGSANSLDCLLDGEGRRIAIGAGCMISYGVQLRTSDSHAILDIAGGCQVNMPEDVVVEPHVWLARDVVVMKGVTIGRGSAVGARSLVTADVAPCTLVAGVPARVLRQGVTWSRASRPDARRIAARIAEVVEGAAPAGGTATTDAED